MFSFNAPAFSPVGLDGIARVVDIHDGDTVSVISRLIDDPRSQEYLFHVRLYGIDAAELKDHNPIIKKFAYKTRQRVIDILNPSGADFSTHEILVHLDIISLDKYGGRFVGNIWPTEDKTQENLSQILLRERYVKPFTGKTKKIEWMEENTF